jgi:hypothetical protein
MRDSAIDMITLLDEYRLDPDYKSIGFVMMVSFGMIPRFVRDDSSLLACHFEQSEKSFWSPISAKSEPNPDEFVELGTGFSVPGSVFVIVIISGGFR